MMGHVAIVGYGVVGQNLREDFPKACAIDPAKELECDHESHDFAFICVPTPSLPGGSCDISHVWSAAHANRAAITVLKSTVPPGTTRLLEVELKRPVVFSPEYAGESVHANGYEYPFVILGSSFRAHGEAVAQLYQRRRTGELRVYHTTPEAAELCKYMENSFLALKVTFCNEFAAMARAIGVSYDELRELWLLDPRIGRSHTFAHPDQPYYDSRCLNKDVPAIVAHGDAIECPMPLMRATVLANEERKSRHGQD